MGGLRVATEDFAEADVMLAPILCGRSRFIQDVSIRSMQTLLKKAQALNKRRERSSRSAE